MAKYDPTHPALSLQGIVQGAPTGIDKYSYNDDSGLYDKFMSYEMLITIPSSQVIYDESTRLTGEYTAIDIKVGDYITTTDGLIILRIKSIDEKSDIAIRLIAEDIDGITYRQNGTNIPSNGASVIIFELSENGLPVFAGSAVDQFTSVSSLSRVQSRFTIDEDDERYRFTHSSPVNVNVGDIVSINTLGKIVKHGDTGSAEIPVGTVISLSSGNTIVYVKPFNKIIDNYPDPTILNASPGEIYYTDVNNPGKITTTAAKGSKAVYLHLKNAITTEVTSTSSSTLPESTDTIVINGITVFNGPGGHSVNDVYALANMIDALSASTNVSAVAEASLISAESLQNNINSSVGDVLMVISTNSGSSFTYPVADFSDGTNSVSITFDPSNYNVFPVNYLGSVAQYKTLRSDEMVTILNSEFTSNNLNLIASTTNAPTGSQNPGFYKGLKIETTDPNASIVITNISPDAFGSAVAGGASATAIELNTVGGTDAFLKLTRMDGGDILITGSPTSGGYINTNGLTSSSAGSAAVLLMIEGSSDATASEVGVNVAEDHDMSPQATTGNGAATGLTITHTPFLGSKVEVRVNGLDANLGDSTNYQIKSCYFSNGFVVRDFEDIVAGDELYWNGTLVGFNLDATDDIDFVYQTSSDNV